MTNLPISLFQKFPSSLPSPENFSAYSRYIAKIPELNEDDEKKLIQLWQNHQDKDAAKILILSHLYLVIKIVRSHSGYGVSESDLAQEGTVGLMKAVQKFDQQKNVRLSTYAWYWIEAEIKEFILKNWRLVGWGTSSLAKKLFFGYRKTLLSLKNLGEERSVPNSHDIAKSLQVSEEDAELARQYFLGKDIEIFMENSEDNDDFIYRNQAVLVDNSPTPEIFTERLQQQNQLEHIKNHLSQLNDNQKYVLEHRFLKDSPDTLTKISTHLNLSVERVRQIEQEAIRLLKYNIKKDLEK